jgi:hypothetical protein
MLKEKLLFVLIYTFLLHIPLLALTHPQMGLQMEKQIHSLRVGWRNFFPVVLLCQFFVFSREIVLGVNYLPYLLCCCVFFWLRREVVLGCTDQFLVVAGNSFRCYLLTYHTSCAIVSDFWLRQEIVFGCTVSKKDSYSVSLIERESASKCVYFVRSNTLLLCISLLCIYLLYLTDTQTHRLDCFLKFPELSGQVGISRIHSKNADRKKY